MEFLNFNRKLTFLRFTNLIVKKISLGFSIVFFLIKKKNMHLMKKCCDSNL